MRTVLFATTALVASAGIAAAEVSLSGAAEMGVAGDDGDDSSDLRFHTDIDVTFTLTGETDTGLSFGADVDLDEEIGDSRPDSDGFHSDATRNDDEDGGASIFISGAFGTLTMGDTDGALDWALQEPTIGGALRDENEHVGIDNDFFDLNAGLDGIYDGQIARYDYAFGDFSVAVSGEIDDNDEGDPALGLGLRYATEMSGVDMGFGFGVQTVSGLGDLVDDVNDTIDPDEDIDDPTYWGVSADFAFANGFRTILNYSDADDFGTNYAIALGYEINAFTIAANYGETKDTPVGDAEGYSLIANYDLGGGAELQAGYANNEDFDGEESDSYSLGVAMAF